ncbi:unnamed protein product [Orchesella dallaii]|uniref:Uncharacterized protein n=1 Tax=Orchesella dallaii TaxID=48710 RepID=A0ABP1Q2U7_9HEXA
MYKDSSYYGLLIAVIVLLAAFWLHVWGYSNGSLMKIMSEEESSKGGSGDEGDALEVLVNTSEQLLQQEQDLQFPQKKTLLRCD